MKTLTRIIFVVILILITLTLLIGIAAYVIIPHPRVRSYAASEIGKKINRQIEMGPLRVAWNGLEMDQLRISEIPRFSAGTLLDAKGIRVGWSLRALWEILDVRRGKLFTRSTGNLFVKDFRNPNFVAQDIALSWSLSGLDDPSKLNGWAKLHQGPGAFRDIDKLVAKSPSAKMALAPILTIMNIDKTGILLGLPDLQYWPVNSIQGNYGFKNGLINIHEFLIKSETLNMGTTGTVDLPSSNLALLTKLHSPKRGKFGVLDIEARVTGPMAKPQVKVSTLKKIKSDD